MSANPGANALVARLLGGGAWALLGKVAAVGLALLVNALLARLLSASDMGAYFLILGILGIAVGVVQFGLPQSIVKLLAEARVTQAPDQVAALARRLLGLAVLTCLAGTGLAWLGVEVATVWFPALAPYRTEVALWLFALGFGGVLAEGFRGLNDIREATLFGGVLTSLLLLCLLAAAWGLGWRLTLDHALQLSVVAAMTSMALALLVTLKRHRGLLRPAPAGMSLAAIAGYCAPMWGNGLLVLFLAQADVILLGLTGDHGEIALYGASARLVALLSTSLIIVNSVISPMIAELHVQGRVAELERLLRGTAALAAAPSVAALLVLVLAGGPVLGLVYGSFYTDGAPVLAVLCIGQLVNVWSGSCNITLLMTGRHRLVFRINLACSIVTLAALVLLTRQYGAMGAATATSAGLCLRNVVNVWVVKRELGVWTTPDLGALWSRLRGG